MHINYFIAKYNLLKNTYSEINLQVMQNQVELITFSL